MTARQEPRSGGRKKRWLWIAAVGAVLAIAGYVGLHVIANGQLRKLLPAAVATAVGGEDADRYAVAVDGVRLAPWLSGLTVRGLTVALDTARAADAEEPALIRSASVRSFHVSGIRLIPLIRGEGIFISSIEIDRPRAELYFALQPGEEPRPEAEATQGAAGAGDGEATGGFEAPPATLERIRIDDASIVMIEDSEIGTALSALHGLDLELTDIRIDVVTAANPARALANSRVVIAFDSASHRVEDSLYVIRTVGLRADSDESLVSIEDFSVIPTLEAGPFFARLKQRADRIDLTAGPIFIRGLDFHRYFAEDALYVRSIEVDSLDLHVFADINIAWGPRARACRYHNGFAEIEVPMTIDTIQLVEADILYSELAKGAARPGELTFEDLSGVVVNVTNDREKMTHETPAVVDVTGKLFGEADVHARLAYPLLSPTLDYSLDASAGSMDMAAFNTFSRNVVGVEVKKGQLDSLHMSYVADRGQASGRIYMLYRDLDFRIFDRNRGKEMPWHTVAGFLGNLVVRSNNPGKPGDEPREGTIKYTCSDKDIVFFEFLVGALGSGMKGIVIG
ncbi:MAG: DUF748 domain-containing protein [Gemmatimonadales bacterium]